MYFLPHGTGPLLILAACPRKTLPSEWHGVNSPTARSRYPERSEAHRLLPPGCKMKDVPLLAVNENPLFELSSCERGGGDAKKSF